MSFLKNKIILVTGGSGTIGKNLIKFLLRNYSPEIIRVFSRDETKQFKLANELSKYEKQLRFFIGDIRDKERLSRAIQNVSIVFHLAALKHVGACEYNPFEAVKTNIIGLQNLIELSIDNNIEKVVFTSTDKAATPCNTMGVTKLLGEKLITAANYYKGKTRTIFYSIRFGNVLGSRGSLIPLIENQVKNNKTITLTHSDMTRYIMDIDSALKLMINTLDLAQCGEVFVLKMAVIKTIDLIQVLVEHLAKIHNKDFKSIQIKEIGMFVGEKMYEELFSIEESTRTYELNDMYVIFPQITGEFPEIDKTKYPNLKILDKTKSFNSKDEYFLTKKEIKDFLEKHKIFYSN